MPEVVKGITERIEAEKHCKLAETMHDIHGSLEKSMEQIEEASATPKNAGSKGISSSEDEASYRTPSGKTDGKERDLLKRLSAQEEKQQRVENLRLRMADEERQQALATQNENREQMRQEQIARDKQGPEWWDTQETNKGAMHALTDESIKRVRICAESIVKATSRYSGGKVSFKMEDKDAVHKGTNTILNEFLNLATRLERAQGEVVRQQERNRWLIEQTQSRENEWQARLHATKEINTLRNAIGDQNGTCTANKLQHTQNKPDKTKRTTT
ncbi:unnamed protein product [Ceutorhynchus assimilis]|uniref:Uncharacterized protein n=1 Tax=Ceutorhynchus assimilis TaxID=467358 RepID=A0A9N9MKJ0_9CUCU|nr:unnamed protein product [Ceutorhynchus assimilis]